MGRIRTIKPETPHSESLGRVSRDARLLFLMLFTIADDEGRGRGNSRMLASLLFPYDDDAPIRIPEWLIELERENSLIVYAVGENIYFQIVNWLEHQKIDKPTKSKHPPPPERARKRRTVAKPREEQTTTLDPSSQYLDQGREGIKESIKEGTKDATPQADVALVVEQPISLPVGVSQQLWADFLEHRRKLRAPMSLKAQDMALKKLAGMPDAAATIERSIIQGWKGLFEATDNGKRTGKETRLDRLFRGMAGAGDDPETATDESPGGDRKADQNPPRGAIAVLPPAGHERGASEREIPAFLLRSRAVS